MIACSCPGWIQGAAQLIQAQMLASMHGQDYTAETFKYCPWCGVQFEEDSNDKDNGKESRSA